MSSELRWSSRYYSISTASIQIPSQIRSTYSPTPGKSPPSSRDHLPPRTVSTSGLSPEARSFFRSSNPVGEAARLPSAHCASLRCCNRLEQSAVWLSQLLQHQWQTQSLLSKTRVSAACLTLIPQSGWNSRSRRGYQTRKDLRRDVVKSRRHCPQAFPELE